jgi:DNA invertase Pin-like site-specific DNA recombinase
VMDGRFVSYFRVSTARQGRSGLGLDAQREAVAAYLNGGNWTVITDFVEVESGRKSDRPELAMAMDLCRLTGATLVIAKLDRLARDAHFLLGLQKAGVEFVACDMPTANRLTIGIMALVAEEEARAISARTKAALAAAKARGTKLGGWRGGPVVDGTLGAEAARKGADVFAAGVAPMLRQMQGEGLSLRQMAARFTDKGIKTPRGGAWTAAAVRNALARV